MGRRHLKFWTLSFHLWIPSSVLRLSCFRKPPSFPWNHLQLWKSIHTPLIFMISELLPPQKTFAVLLQLRSFAFLSKLQITRRRCHSIGIAQSWWVSCSTTEQNSLQVLEWSLFSERDERSQDYHLLQHLQRTFRCCWEGFFQGRTISRPHSHGDPPWIEVWFPQQLLWHDLLTAPHPEVQSTALPDILCLC